MEKLLEDNILPQIDTGKFGAIYIARIATPEGGYINIARGLTEKELTHELRKIYWSLQQFLKLKPKQ